METRKINPIKGIGKLPTLDSGYILTSKVDRTFSSRNRFLSLSPNGKLIRVLEDRVFLEFCLELLLIRWTVPDPKESVLLRFWLVVYVGLSGAGEVDWGGVRTVL